MLVKTIAKKYATALYEIAKGQGQIEENKATLLGITSSLGKRAYEAFSNPGITKKDKEAGIQRVFAGKLSKELINFFSLLIEKKRFVYLPEIAKEFTDLYDKNHGLKAAEIQSAFSLSEDQKKKITDALEKKYKSRFRVNFSVEAALLGGMVICVDTEMYDGSLQNRLVEIGNLLK